MFPELCSRNTVPGTLFPEHCSRNSVPVTLFPELCSWNTVPKTLFPELCSWNTKGVIGILCIILPCGRVSTTHAWRLGFSIRLAIQAGSCMITPRSVYWWSLFLCHCTQEHWNRLIARVFSNGADTSPQHKQTNKQTTPFTSTTHPFFLAVLVPSQRIQSTKGDIFELGRYQFQS